MIDPSAFVHPMAVVTDSFVGAGTKVWQFASVIRGARIGADCTIANGATIDGSTVGDRCIVCHNVAMGPGFRLGDDVFVGPNATICNDRWPCANKNGFDADLLRSGNLAVLILDGASIGANAVVLPGVVIGERSMVAAHAVADRDVLADHLLCRNGDQIEIKPEWRMKRMRYVDGRHAAVGCEREIVRVLAQI